jgi:hypothetical protein
MPLKVYLRSEGTENGNTVVIDYTSVYTSYTEGSVAIPFGDCSGDHDIEKRSGVDYVETDQYAPAMGDPGSLEEYELPDAVDYAKAQSTGLKNFLGQNPNAFLLNASSDEFTVPGERGWDLYFGKSDDTQAYHVFVTKTSIEDYGKVAVNPIGRSVKDYSTLMTFSSAEEVMKGDATIGGKVYTSGGDFKFASYSFGCRSDVPIPTPDVPISFDIITGATEYYFYVESKDGKYSAGIDGATGQILFVQTKTES